MESLEAQLEQSCVKQQLEELQRQLELLEVEKKEVEARVEKAEKKNEELEDRGGWRWTHTHTHTVEAGGSSMLHSNRKIPGSDWLTCLPRCSL